MDGSIERGLRMAATLLLLGLLLHGAGCGSEDADPDTFCCAIKQICSICDCTSEPGVAQIGEAGDGDACRFVLEDNDLDCVNLSEEVALANCVSR